MTGRALAFLAAGLMAFLMLEHAGDATQPLLIETQAITDPGAPAKVAYRVAPCVEIGPTITPPIEEVQVDGLPDRV
jgi:hypothetical protein